MQPTEIEKWLNTLGASKKRRRDEFSVEPFGDRDGCKYRKTYRCRITKLIGLRRSRSDGDIACPRELSNSETTNLPRTSVKRTDMANPNPSPPATSPSRTMPPPPRPPSSRPTSRTHSQSTLNSSRPDSTTSSNNRHEVLRRNRIFIEHEKSPEDVQAAVKSILENKDKEFIVGDNYAKEIAALALANESGGEGAVIKGLVPTLFPDTNRSISLVRDDKKPFEMDAMPHPQPPFGLKITIPTVSNPAPDLLYGYPIQAFNFEQEASQQNIDEESQCRLSKTTGDVYWGFFIVEFKSQATGGTIWAATNQCAGAGSACTNALDRMLKTATGNDSSARSDSICFSLAIDGQTASLHVHWHDNSAQDFYCSRVQSYFLYHVDGVKDLKADIDRILRWGIDARLTAIKSALDRFFLAATRGENIA